MRMWSCSSRSSAGTYRELFRVQALDQALGEDRHAVGAAVGQALDDRADQGVDHLVEPIRSRAELFRDQRERRAGGLADAEREVAGFAAHRDHEVPARGGLRVDQQVLHDAGADVARGLVAEGVDALGQIEIVVDGLGHVDDFERALECLGEAHGGERRVVAADA